MEMSQQTFRLVTHDEGEQGNSIEVAFHVGGKACPVFFRCDDRAFAPSTEAFSTCAILPCMRAGEEKLVVEGDVCEVFHEGLSTIQDIFCQWDKSLRQVDLGSVPTCRRASNSEGRVGTFFSGGVDSFYTLLKHQEEITDLIFVHGFDIRLSDTALREKTSKKIREVGAAFGKNIVEVETNIRELLNPHVNWGTSSHGAGLTAVGHLLSSEFQRIYIPATHTYADLFAWGTHPVLDHWWSSASLEFVHDGCEATRVEKVAALSKSEIALRTLRVCWKNPNSSYNCGVCEKCLRTMIILKVFGVLEQCPTFDAQLDLKRVRRIVVKGASTRSFVEQNVQALLKDSQDDQLRKALQKVLDRPRWSRQLRGGLGYIMKRYKNRFQ